MVADVDHLGCLVEEARRIVWEQKGRIIRLRAAGHDTWDAHRILQLLEANLQNLREYKHRLECESRQASDTIFRLNLGRLGSSKGVSDGCCQSRTGAPKSLTS
jgi:hypothetical protein